MNDDIESLKSLVAKLRDEKYPDAEVIFLAGSVVRGEATSTSDLDLVVMYKNLPNAYRESFCYEDWPVEAFVHDPETLKYFIEKMDAPTGFPSLAAMVSEGIEIPGASDFSSGLKIYAKQVLKVGPPKWNERDINNSRYLITDLVEDLKDPRNNNEVYAIATVLYSALSNHYFRSRGLWSAKGKTIPRRLKKISPALADKFLLAFECAFGKAETEKLIALAEEILCDNGGFLFEGYRIDAPGEWRI